MRNTGSKTTGTSTEPERIVDASLWNRPVPVELYAGVWHFLHVKRWLARRIVWPCLCYVGGFSAVDGYDNEWTEHKKPRRSTPFTERRIE